jgi:hypothetical protein
MIIRRALTTTAATVAAIALAAGPASAHFCYKNDVNAKAWVGMYGSNGWLRIGDLAEAEFGLCEAGIEVFSTGIGGTPDTLLNGHGVMAGPTGGNKAIGHLDISQFEAALDAAVEACEGPAAP